LIEVHDGLLPVCTFGWFPGSSRSGNDVPDEDAKTGRMKQHNLCHDELDAIAEERCVVSGCSRFTAARIQRLR